MLSVNFDVARRSFRRAVVQELVVVALGTFDVHFVGSAVIFFAGLVADAGTEE